MDEIGFKVRAITPDGFVMLSNSQQSQRQPQDRRFMVGQPALVVSRTGVVAEGVFASPSGHVLSGDLLDQGHLNISDFFLDLGADSQREVVDAGVHVGASVVFGTQCRRLGNRVVGKALDDRLMLAIMTRLAEGLRGTCLSTDLWFSATVQEENGLHGARVLANAERFDSVVTLDVGLVGDTPLLEPHPVGGALGCGPIVAHSDQELAYSEDLTWALLDIATTRNIRCQHGSFTTYTSNGHAFFQAGMPTALVTTPVRYTHTAFEMADLRDALATVELLNAYVTRA